MHHIGISLADTSFAKKFHELTNELHGPVNASYLHVSLAIIIGDDFTNLQAFQLRKITEKAAQQIKMLEIFTTGQFDTDEHGYVLLPVNFKGLDAVIGSMIEELEEAGFKVKDKRPFHTTVVKASFSEPPSISQEEMQNMQSVLNHDVLKKTLCDQTFDLQGAVFGQLKYPKGKGIVEVAVPFHEFTNNTQLLAQEQPRNPSLRFR